MTDEQKEGFRELAGIVEYLVVALLPKAARKDATEMLARLDAARNKVLYGNGEKATA